MEINNFKKRSHKHHHNSIDGFISADSFKKASGSIEFEKRGHGRLGQDQANKIDDFNRPDGYHPTVPTVTGTEPQTSLLSATPRHRHQPGGIENGISTNNKPKRRRKLRTLPHRPKSWPKFIAKTALTLTLLAFLTGGFLAYKLYATQKQVFKGGGQAPGVCDGNIPISKLNSEGDSRVNVLLAGIGGPGHDGPDLTDTLILASIDTVNNKIDLLSIPRDLWVKSSGYSSNKINAVYAFAKQASSSNALTVQEKDGLKALDSTVKKVMGVPIHYNVLVDFTAFKDAVNAVGGVNVNVPETLYDPTIAWENHNNPYIALKGNQTFNGAKALLYAKSRETSSDFARGERQRLLLVALKDKALSLGTYANPLKVSNLLDSFGNNVYTDFDIGSVKCLYKQISQVPSSSIKSLDLVKPPNNFVTTGDIGGQSVVRPIAGLYDYSQIQNYIRNTLKDSLIAKENANITILNGTNVTALATKEATLLKSYGYNVGLVGDAPNRNYQKTVLVELRGDPKKYTQHYLENRLSVTAVNKLPDNSISSGSADFVIILGADAAYSS